MAIEYAAGAGGAPIWLAWIADKYVWRKGPPLSTFHRRAMEGITMKDAKDADAQRAIEEFVRQWGITGRFMKRSFS